MHFMILMISWGSDIITQDTNVLHLFRQKIIDIILISPWKNIFGYSFEVPFWGSSNEYPKHMFSWRDKKVFIRIFLNSLHAGHVFFLFFFVVCGFFLKNQFFQKSLSGIQEYHQSVKKFGSRSGRTFCWAWSGSKLFAKVINRRQKSPLLRKLYQHLSDHCKQSHTSVLS